MLNDSDVMKSLFDEIDDLLLIQKQHCDTSENSNLSISFHGDFRFLFVDLCDKYQIDHIFAMKHFMLSRINNDC